MADEGLHEIQLKGKQLVFLFMASTVVAVVIFLCGVMVGRGVPLQRAGAPADASIDTVTDPTSPVQPGRAAASGTSSSDTPAPKDDELVYPNVLEEKGEPPEGLLEPVAPKALAPGKAAQVKAEPEADLAETTSATAGRQQGEPSGNGFVVQVAAVNDRREAEKIAGRLAGKGYPSFVSTPANGAAHMFRVRIGKYKERRQAELIASRLQKEERFKPWITR